MMRDKEGARLVNLAPPRITWTGANDIDPVSLPGDFYSLLGTKVWREHPELRHFFKDGNPFDREIVKRTAMAVAPGGGKLTSLKRVLRLPNAAKSQKRRA
jgi:hypothetical protein